MQNGWGNERGEKGKGGRGEENEKDREKGSRLEMKKGKARREVK